jgi:hypothetical protein
MSKLDAAARQERVQLIAKLPMEARRKIRSDAGLRGDGDLANDAHKAMEPQELVQTDELANSGRLIPKFHRDDAGRKITTYIGDFAAAYGQFMSGGQGVRINRNTYAGKAPDHRPGANGPYPAGTKIDVRKQ